MNLQTLTSLMMGLKCVADSCPAESRHCQLDDMRALIKQTLGEIHRLAVELRPSVLDDMGLVAALEKYIAHFRENYALDVDLHVEWQGEERVAHEIEVTVYRIVQEALTNVIKYAHAQNVSIIVTHSSWGLEVIVEDDGVGFDADAIFKEGSVGSRLGLYGMIERATLVGGSLTVESTAGAGTTIFVRIPVRQGEQT